MREVQALRRQGVEVETISIHRAGPEHVISAADREEAARTYSLLPPRWLDLVRAHGRALLRAPGAYVATLARAVSQGPAGIRNRVWRGFYFAEGIVLWDVCRRKGVRHLHAHHINQAADAAELACQYANGRGGERWTWSFTMHGPNEFYEVSRYRLVEKVRDAALVSCISDFCRSQVMGHVEAAEWGKLHIVHCGVDPTEFPAAPPAPDGRAVNLLYVGRMVPVKGQRLLLEAVRRLASEGIDIHATLIGSGPSLPEVAELVTSLGLDERVTLPGAVGQDEIQGHYAAAHIFCLPSFAEGVPVVLMEAMAIERPVVTTRIMGIPELVDDGVQGLLVAPGNLDELVDALRKLATDPAARAAMGRAGREKVVADFDVNQSAEALAGLFARVVS